MMKNLTNSSLTDFLEGGFSSKTVVGNAVVKMAPSQNLTVQAANLNKISNFVQNIGIKLSDITDVLFNNLPQFIVVIRNDKIEYINPQALKLLKIDHEQEVLGTKFLKYVDKAYWSTLTQNISTLILEHKTQDIKLVNGQKLCLSAIYLPDSQNFAFIFLGAFEQPEKDHKSSEEEFAKKLQENIAKLEKQKAADLQKKLQSEVEKMTAQKNKEFEEKLQKAMQQFETDKSKEFADKLQTELKRLEEEKNLAIEQTVKEQMSTWEKFKEQEEEQRKKEKKENKKPEEPIFNILYDKLTSLPSFYLFEDRMQHTVNVEIYGNNLNKFTAIAAISINNIADFKSLNLDSFILKQIAANLAQNLDKTWTVARGLKCPFWILFTGIKDSISLEKALKTVCQTLAKPIRDNFVEHQINFSIGVSTFPNPASSAKKLMENTLLAVKQAKNNNFYIYK